MTDTFFDFIMETTSENFTRSQNEVFNHSDYNPYSDEIGTIESFLDKGDFLKAVEFSSINTILSPRAHLFKNYALEKLKRDKDAQSELIFAQKIMEGISLTGDGSKESPYRVTSVSDERDMLRYFQEEFMSQSLITEGQNIFDLIICQSGKEIYFDISKPYLRMNDLMNEGKIQNPIEKMMEEEPTKRKRWWEFWK